MTENNGLDALKQQIKEFIKQDTPEIFALTGTWGVGKTFALKNVIAELKETDTAKEELKKYTYVSSFGLSSIDDVKTKIFTNYHVSKKVDKFKKVLNFLNDTKVLWIPIIIIISLILLFVFGGIEWLSSSNKKMNGFFFVFFTIFTLFSSFFAWHENKNNTLRAFVRDLAIEETLKDKIICFDDFERTSIDTQELLGFLQDLKEERNCKIILIYNHEKLDNRKADFDTYREKVIDKHFDYTPSPSETVDLAFKGKENNNPFSAIEEYKDFIAEKCEDLKLNNIRIIQKVLKHINKDIQPILKQINWSSDIYPDIQKEVTAHLISVIILYAFLYFQDNYKEKDLEISKEDFEKYFKSEEEIPEYLYKEPDEKFQENYKEREVASNEWKKKQEWFSNFIGTGYVVLEKQFDILGIVKCITYLINGGYLLENQKNDLKEKLDKFNAFKAHKIYKEQKKRIWSAICRERHNKFLSDDYPQRFYQAAKDVVVFEGMSNINFMVRFLKDHNMPTQAQEIIDLFINSSEEYRDFALSTDNLFSLDINTMDSDLKQACEKRYQELYNHHLLNQILLEDALAQIYIKKAYNQEHQYKVENATKTEIKSFFSLDSLEGFAYMGSGLIRQNPKNAIPALYEIYQEANKPQKNQIRANEIFGDSLREALKNDNLDKSAKDMIAEMLQSNR